MITVEAEKFYFFDEKQRKHGPHDTIEELYTALHKYAEELKHELQRESTRSLREPT